jgi:hypothetical protein
MTKEQLIEQVVSIDDIHCRRLPLGRTRILKHLPGVLDTQAGRANGCTKPLKQTMMVMQNVSKQP